MKILAIGAHPDDIEIGCGGTLAAHSKAGDEIMIVVMTAGEQGGAHGEVRLKEAKNGALLLGAKHFDCLHYPDTQIPLGPAPVHDLEMRVEGFKPDRVYIPFYHEIHQDHRTTSEAALVACRNIPQILMYEGPSTFSNFQVSYWVNISQTIEQKIAAIQSHTSQGVKELLKVEAIQGMNRFRGYQARTQYAEGFAIFRFIENI